MYEDKFAIIFADFIVVLGKFLRVRELFILALIQVMHLNLKTLLFS